MALKNRLPGIYFQAEIPETEESLPRMDIAAFIGLAESGPLHTPVPIEDKNRFWEIFGDNLELARDAATHRKQYAYLASSVKAFFLNGGRRCWVVRVADTNARSNLFPLTSLVRVDNVNNTFLPAVARARSEGSWSDKLRFGTVQTGEAFNVEQIYLDNWNIDIFETIGVLPGDLVQLNFSGNNLLLMRCIESIETVSGYLFGWDEVPGNDSKELIEFLRQKFGVNLVDTAKIEKIDDGKAIRISSPENNFSLVLNDEETKVKLRINEGKIEELIAKTENRKLNIYVSGDRKPIKRIQGKDYWLQRGFLSAETKSVEAVLCSPLGEKRQCTVWLPDEGNPSFRVTLDHMVPEITAPGSLLSIEINEPGEPIQSLLPSLKLLLIVTSVEPVSETSSPPEETVIMKGEEGFWILEEAKARELAGQWLVEGQFQQILANRLTFQISEWKDQEMSVHLSNLAFCKKHPRFWGNLPDDISLFCLDDDSSDRPTLLDMEASEPRFPLAAPEERFVGPVYLPVGMPVMPDVTTTQGPINPVEPDTALQRNGLKHFSADMFLDSSLTQTSSESLLQEAWYKRYRTDGHDIVQLHGMHSVLPLDEVTIISIPDAIHREWVREPVNVASPSDVLPAPDLKSTIQFNDHDTYVLSWSGVEGADQYILEEGTDPAFLVSSPAYKGNDITCQVRPGNNGVYYYRVKAKRNKMMSSWSNTQMVVVPYSEFEECQSSLLKAPELHKIDRCRDNCEIHWTSVPGAIHYVLQASADPGFFASSTIYQGIEETFSFRPMHEGIYYYRVRAFNGNSWGPWSNTHHIVFDFLPSWTVQNPDTYDDYNLLTIHRSLLQMCAARGDMLAVLTLPSHYQEKDVVAHVNALKLKRFLTSRKKDVEAPLNQREKHMLSFGALYHPWVLTSKKESFIIPPDGAVCGLMASKAIREGAWIAPANEPLNGVLSLEPVISLQAWSTLFEHQVNLIRPDPHGYLILSANTLSPDLHLQPINVRRLLILLRRLALREGTTYVFQQNDERFHRLIRHTFHQLLANLYMRGAFAGDTPEKAYRVVADASLNTQKSLEQGRFIVDLRVAPSKPMVFVTVRLVQTGHENSVVMEV